VHRQSRVDDGVDEDDVAALDLAVEVLEEADPVAVCAVAGQLDEVEGVEDRQRLREVGEEGDAGLQRADEQRLSAAEVALELGPELADALPELVRVEEDLADPLAGPVRARCGECAQDAFARPKRTASRSKSRS
jgi:hypothetical protein